MTKALWDLMDRARLAGAAAITYEIRMEAHASIVRFGAIVGGQLVEGHTVLADQVVAEARFDMIAMAAERLAHEWLSAIEAKDL